ncbi:histidine phosphatase family protein [Leptobacterium flavescens]|uniref:Histidine phosphatase family protein n=1 Tax=Leptobacterium flavescens TaxID=472055 RepID=A0A6P0UUF4_9FLAO|nr:histidine phosphatase family protein [Leptobacterium flavescens]NER14046.1 histidine phosphatase family protein [Leptobacterium flavescens]
MLNRKLILVRHAKSSWNYDAADRDRPLAQRGINDAHLVSSYLGGKLPSADAVFSSPANRALHTCTIFLRNLNIPFSKLTVTEDLYDFGGEGVVRFLKNADDSHQTIMIFGHNHAFTSVANLFGSTYIDNVTTSGVVVIEFNTDSWKNIDEGKTELTLFPKQLKK